MIFFYIYTNKAAQLVLQTKASQPVFCQSGEEEEGEGDERSHDIAFLVFHTEPPPCPVAPLHIYTHKRAEMSSGTSVVVNIYTTGKNF